MKDINSYLLIVMDFFTVESMLSTFTYNHVFFLVCGRKWSQQIALARRISVPNGEK